MPNFINAGIGKLCQITLIELNTCPQDQNVTIGISYAKLPNGLNIIARSGGEGGCIRA
jgi:hypothetical protein